MAAELSVSRVKHILSGDAEVHFRGQILMAVCGLAVLLALGSVIVGTWQARADEQAALQRYADAEALLALPPVDIDALQAERDAAVADLEAARAQLQPPSVDPSSDAATTLLVERATAGGLTVRGVSSVPPGEARVGDAAYDLAGVRMILEGNVGSLISFLAVLHEQEPGVMPALNSLTTDENGLSVMDVSFNVYTEVATATPVVPAGEAP
jgi:hypothetical protein